MNASIRFLKRLSAALRSPAPAALATVFCCASLLAAADTAPVARRIALERGWPVMDFD